MKILVALLMLISARAKATTPAEYAALGDGTVRYGLVTYYSEAKGYGLVGDATSNLAMFFIPLMIEPEVLENLEPQVTCVSYELWKNKATGKTFGVDMHIVSADHCQ